MMTTFKTTVISALLLIVSQTRVPAQIAPVGEKIMRAESANFIYIYPEQLSERLPALSKVCEDAYTLLTPVFRWTPHRKTHVVYHDSWDLHNAFATIYPVNLICIYAVNTARPDTFGDTLRTTVFHEFAHILSIDAQYKLNAGLASVFGRVLPMGDFVSLLLAAASAPPGQLAPIWYLEGLAMWAETEFAGPGRGRSPLVDMYIRMPYLDNNLLSPEQWSLDLPVWPYGNSAYIYGMKSIAFAQSLSDDPERNVPGELSDSVARSFLFFFNKQSLQATGKTFTQLAYDSLSAEEKRQIANIEILKSRPVTPTVRLTPKDVVAYSPKFAHDGKSIFFSAKEADTRETLHRIDIETGVTKKIHPTLVQAGITEMAMSQDRKTVYYNRLNIRGRDKIRYEMKEYKIHKNRVKTVTRDGRYRFIAIHPDNLTMAAVRDEEGYQLLLETQISSAGKRNSEKILVKVEPGDILLDPVYSPDGQQLVYVIVADDSSRLISIDLNSGKSSQILEISSIILAPVFHPSGNELVFSSDINGVYNLYRLDLSGNAAPTPLTSVIGGIFKPDFSPDGKSITAQSYDSYGYYITTLNYKQIVENAPDRQLPVIRPDWTPVKANTEKSEKAKALPEPSLATLNPAPYQSLSNVRLNFWWPWFTANSENVAGGLGAVFSDPVDFQRVTMLGGYSEKYDMPVGSFNYGYFGFYPIFKVFGNYDAVTYYDLFENTRGQLFDYDEKQGVIGSAITFPINTVDHQLGLTFGFKFSHHASITKLPDNEQQPITENIFEGTEFSLLFDALFTDADVFDTSSSLEDGRLILASLEHSAEIFGAGLARTRCLLNWVEYVPMPWRRNNLLRLEALAGTGTSDETLQSFFGLGGFGPSQDIFTPGIESAVGLRGYKNNTATGRSIIKAGAAYRFPLIKSYKGAGATIPLYYHQLFGEIFYEGGKTSGGIGARDGNWLNAAGAELNLSLTLFRFVAIAPGIGYVYAFDREDGEKDNKSQMYLSLKGIVNF